MSHDPWLMDHKSNPGPWAWIASVKHLAWVFDSAARQVLLHQPLNKCFSNFMLNTILYGPYDKVCEAILGVSKFISIAWPTRWFDFDAGGTIVPPMSWPSFLNACVTHTVTPQTLCGVFQYLKWFVLKNVTVLLQYHLYHPYIERILHRLEQWDHCIPWYECFHRQPTHSLVNFPRHNIFVDLDHHKDWFHNDQGTY